MQIPPQYVNDNTTQTCKPEDSPPIPRVVILRPGCDSNDQEEANRWATGIWRMPTSTGQIEDLAELLIAINITGLPNRSPRSQTGEGEAGQFVVFQVRDEQLSVRCSRLYEQRLADSMQFNIAVCDILYNETQIATPARGTMVRGSR